MDREREREEKKSGQMEKGNKVQTWDFDGMQQKHGGGGGLDKQHHLLQPYDCMHPQIHEMDQEIVLSLLANCCLQFVHSY